MKRSTRQPLRSRSHRKAQRRRGVAMLLVLIALGTATVLSGSYLMSRRTAPAIGANAETSSNAKWAARSGANLAVAILETSYEVGGTVEATQLLSGVTIGVGSADAMVTGMTGNPLTADESRVLVSAIGSADSIGALSQRVLLRRATNKITQALDPTLSEFAVYATQRLRVQSGSYIAPWPDSERGPSLFAANIGLGFGASGLLDIASAGSLTTSRLVVDGDATASLVTTTKSAAFAGGIVTGLQFPTASERVPTELTAIGTSGPAVLTWNTGMTYNATRPDYDAINVTLACTFVFDEAVSPVYSVNDLTIDLIATVRIKGNVRILIRDDLIISNRSRIELADANSSVEFFVLDDVEINNAVIGLPQSIATNNSRSYTDLSGSYDASAIRICLIDPSGGGAADQYFSMSSRSMVVADVHAPAAEVDLSGNSVIVGRLTGAGIRMQNNSIVFYDHALNPGAGFTDLSGPLYDSGRYATLRDALASFNNAAGLPALASHIQNFFAKAGVNPDPDEPGPISAIQPDPRLSGKVTPMPMRRGGARALESGGSPSTFEAVMFADVGSALSQVLGGVRSALRLDQLDAGDGLEPGEGGLVGNVLAGLLGGN